jgi:molecular chaperone DnaK
MRYHKVVGIDLGTTYSAVSVWDYDRKEVVVIPTAIGDLTLPSVVGLDDDQQVIVGRPAQQRRVFEPADTVIEIKRDMGVYEEGRAPDPTRNEPGVPKRVHFRGRDYLPQEISAFILAELKAQAERFLGEPVHDAVITVPAYFKEPQRGATEDAAAIARLNVKQLLNEPTAAAVAFGADEAGDERQHLYAVYDLGGGTFDVSIIEVGAGNVSIVGTGGNPKLGGSDFDDDVTEWVLGEIQRRHGVNLRQDRVACARIKQEAEARKRELSAANSAMINLPFLTPQVSVNLTLTRATFNALVEKRLQESIECLGHAIQSAEQTRGIRKEDIEQVLLVGGSSRIPRVRSLLAQFMDHLEEKDIRSDINPDEAVSRGAALVARRHNPSDAYQGVEVDLVGTGAITSADREEATALTLADVTSHTLGILVQDRDFCPLIPKDSRIPAVKTDDRFVNAGPSRGVDVLIFQGENPIAFDNTLIGKLPIPLPEPREKGYWRFEVTFELDLNGILHVTVKRLNDNESFRVDVQCGVRSSAGRIEEGATHLEQVMASGDGLSGEAATGPSAAPSARVEPTTPARQPAASTGAEPAAVEIAPEPPENTPPEFRSIARRSYKLLQQPMDAAARRELTMAYNAFLAAVRSNAADVESLGDALADVYEDAKR